MPFRARWLAVALAAAALAAAPSVPDDDYAALVAKSMEVIRASVKGEVSPREVRKAATTAILIAEVAQQSLDGPDAAQRATLRDAALELAATIRKKDFPAALKQVDALKTLKFDPKAKKERVKLDDRTDYKELMQQYRHENLGGLGYEDLFTDLGSSPDKAVPAKALTDDLRRAAYHSVVVADLMAFHVPKMKADEWKKACTAMKQDALDLAAAVKAKDGATAYKTVVRLNETCNRCHQEFRRD